MSRFIARSLTVCGLLFLGSSCYQPQAGPVMTEVSSPAADQRSSDKIEAASDDLPQPASDDSPSAPLDAEEILKSALARATDDEKRVLVHLGAPG